MSVQVSTLTLRARRKHQTPPEATVPGLRNDERRGRCAAAKHPPANVPWWVADGSGPAWSQSGGAVMAADAAGANVATAAEASTSIVVRRIRSSHWCVMD